MQEKKISILSALKNSKCVKMFFVKTHEHQICIFLSYLRQNSHQDPLRCMGLKPKYESRDLLKKKNKKRTTKTQQKSHEETNHKKAPTNKKNPTQKPKPQTWSFTENKTQKILWYENEH